MILPTTKSTRNNLFKSSRKPVEEIERIVRKHLIDGEWFYASEWKVPDLHFENWDCEDDHFLHEFGWVQESNEAPTHNTPIEQFLEFVEHAKNHF